MIKIGVQTKGILPDMGIEEGIELIHRAGFERVDFNLDTFLKNSDLYAGKVNSFFNNDIEQLMLYFAQYRVALERNGMKPSQMHAPYPVWVINRWQQNEYMQGSVIPKSIVIAEALGVPWVVIHPFKMQYIYGIEKEHQANLNYLKMLIPLLKQCHVGVCVENLYESVGGRIVEGTCADPEEAAWYVDTLNEYAGEELFGICLDTGHLLLTKRDPYTYIKTVGKRLKIVHMHENDTKDDLHQMPYTFGRNAEDGLDWKRFAQALKEIQFDGTLSFETYPCMHSFPDSVRETILETIHAIGMDLKNQIEMD